MRHFCSGPFRFQRLALLPTADPPPIEELRSALQKLSEAEQQQLLTLIQHQGLQFFWLEALRILPVLPFTSAWRERLKGQCFHLTARYLVQKKSLIEMDMQFEKEQIPYAVFKGAHIREIIYNNPSFRSSADIDILISPNDKLRAISRLCANGYTLHAHFANVNYEVTLVKDHVHLDLHWHTMRPGRTRIDLTNIFLQSRQRCNFFWALDANLTLLVLLTHPVFTEYSTGPQSSIVKLAELRKWITKQDIDWQKLLHLLEVSGQKTAAWITATHLVNLTDCLLPTHFYEAVSPQNPKRFLLNQWLALDLSSKFAAHPFLPKYIFTLLAHDNFSDMFRFIRKFRVDRRNDAGALLQLQQASQEKT